MTRMKKRLTAQCVPGLILRSKDVGPNNPSNITHGCLQCQTDRTLIFSVEVIHEPIKPLVYANNKMGKKMNHPTTQGTAVNVPPTQRYKPKYLIPEDALESWRANPAKPTICRPTMKGERSSTLSEKWAITTMEIAPRTVKE